MRRPNAVQPLITMRLGLLVAAARVLGGRDADVERIGRGLRCLAVDKCATMGRDLRPETTGSWRKTPSPRRRRYATERPMSAIFAANAAISARRNNASISTSAIR